MLQKRDHMQAKNYIGIRAGPALTNSSVTALVGTSWKTVTIIVVAVLLSILLVTEHSRAAKFEKGAEMAFWRAEQLLHEADKENRSVRPLPLSTARV